MTKGLKTFFIERIEKMLKEICIIIVIIASIIGFNFFIQDYLGKTSNEFVTKLDEVALKLKDTENINFDEIEGTISELESKWNETEEIWMLIIVHSDLDMVDKTIKRLQSTLELKQEMEAYVNIKELQFLIDHIAKKDAFILKNLF